MNDDSKLAAVLVGDLAAIVLIIGTTWRWIDGNDNVARIECVKAGQSALDCESLLDGVRK